MSVNTFCDLESERVLICQMILNSDIIADVYNTIKPNEFYNAEYKKCYEFLFKQFSEGKDIDQTMFLLNCEFISAKDRADILDATYTASNWEFYANKIKQNYLARFCLNVCKDTLANLSLENATEMLSKLSNVTNSAMDNSTAGKRTSLKDLSPEYLKLLDERVLHRGELLGYETGIEELDNILGGIQNEYIIIAARPSMGKTALAQQIAMKIANKHKICFFELEMGKMSIMDRYISMTSGVEVNKIRSMFMSQNQMSAIADIANSLDDITKENFILRTELYDIDSICAAARSEVLTKKCKAVFIDHAGLITNKSSGLQAWEKNAMNSHKLQKLQRELNVPVVLLSQLDRSAEEKKTSMANIRGSGAFEEDADVIMAIEHERAKASTETLIPAEIVIKKQRNGSCGSVPVYFLPKKVKFIKRDENNDKTKTT